MASAQASGITFLYVVSESRLWTAEVCGWMSSIEVKSSWCFSIPFLVHTDWIEVWYGLWSNPFWTALGFSQDSCCSFLLDWSLLFSVCEVFECLCSILNTYTRGGICDIDNGCQAHLHKLKDRWRMWPLASVIRLIDSWGPPPPN